MMSKKKLVFIMPVMKGGGAEKVAALLLNEFNKNGCECELILTNSDRNEIVDRGLDSAVKITVLRELFGKSNAFKKLFVAAFRAFASLICKIPEALGTSVPAYLACLSFKAQYYDELNALKKVIANSPDAKIISFLQPSIPLTLLAAKGLPNKIVVSERGDPKKQMKKRYGYNFIKKYYQRADAVVFQTNDAKAAYPENIAAKGTVIFNPINDKLPEPYFGEREKRVVNFCRITEEKNLVILIDAFADFRKDFADYELDIYGDPVNGKSGYVDKIKKHVAETGCENSVHIRPARSDIHTVIRNYAMFASSSDHEGMSNSMLEAMAIGMPVICTDCPIGGANAVIKSGENGILTEVGNAKEMSEAMKKIASDKAFADKLSLNAAKIRSELSLVNTAKKWMELI